MRVLDPQSGFSLLESLVAMAVFAMVSGVLFMVFAGTTRQFSYSTKTVSLQTDLAGALNVFLDDVSLTGFTGYTATAYNPSAVTTATGADGTDTLAIIPPATALAITLNGGTNGNPTDSIQFVTDIASPGSLSPDGRPDRVTYQVTSGNLTRTIELGDTSAGYTAGTTTDALAANVTGFQLRVYDKTHTSITTNFQNACYVGATVYTSDSSVKGNIPLSKSLSGEAGLRNFLSLATCTN